MKIKIKKDLKDIDKAIRPKVGKEYSVVEIVKAKYNPQTNRAYRIISQGKKIAIFPEECVITER